MIVKRPVKSAIKAFALSVLFTTLITACGGGGSSSSSSSTDTVLNTASAVTLAWDAPLARIDNTPLPPGEIAGYRIYYGTKEGYYPNYVDLDDGTATQVKITDLSPGTYYFVVTTYDTDGLESTYSNVATTKL